MRAALEGLSLGKGQERHKDVKLKINVSRRSDSPSVCVSFPKGEAYLKEGLHVIYDRLRKPAPPATKLRPEADEANLQLEAQLLLFSIPQLSDCRSFLEGEALFRSLPLLSPRAAIMGDPRESSSYSVAPRIRYNTIGGVNGPLVILESVSVDSDERWKVTDGCIGQIP